MEATHKLLPGFLIVCTCVAIANSPKQALRNQMIMSFSLNFQVVTICVRKELTCLPLPYYPHTLQPVMNITSPCLCYTRRACCSHPADPEAAEHLAHWYHKLSWAGSLSRGESECCGSEVFLIPCILQLFPQLSPTNTAALSRFHTYRTIPTRRIFSLSYSS